MEEGRGARRPALSSSGCSWAAFEEKAKDYELKSGLRGSNRLPFSPTARQLCREDMAIYGEEPACDSLALVVCQQCSRVVKSQALSKHKDLYHSKVLHIPPPKHIHTVGQPSSAGVTDEPRGPHSGGPRHGESSLGGRGGEGGGAVMGFAATELPRQNSTSIDIGDNKTGSMDSGTTTKSREYDPNRHCGVWIDDDKRHCTRSLTCKFHPLSQKGKVLGRSRPYAELLEEHRRRKKLKKQGKLTSVSGGLTPSSLPQPSPTDPPPLTAHSLYPTTQNTVPPSPSLPLHSTPSLDKETEDRGRGSEEGGGQWVPGEDQSEDDEPNDRGLPSCPEYPTPLAVCSFGGRATRSGCLVFGRRSDNLRSVLATLGGRTRDFTETTLHRKHSYSALLQQRNERQYFTHKDMFSQDTPSLRPVVTPNISDGLTSTITQYTTPLPPPSPPPTLPTPITTSTNHHLTNYRPHPLNTSTVLSSTEREFSSLNSAVSEPHQHSYCSPAINGDMGAVTEYGVGVVMDTPSDRGGGLLGGGGGGGGDDGVREGQREKKSNKEQRKRSRRGGGGRRKQRRTGGNSTVEAGKEPADEEPIPNHVPTSHPSDSTSVSMATLGDSVGVANLPVPLRVVSDGTAGGVMTSESTHQQSVGMRGSGGEGKTGGTNGRKGSIGYDFRAVRIKEEPVDDSTTSDHHHNVHRTHPSKPHSLLPNGVISSSLSNSPVRSYNSANVTRSSPQTFVINPSDGGHAMMTSLSPHLSGLLPIRGSSLQQQQQTTQQQQSQPQQQQQQQSQSFTFGHSLQGLPMQMINDTFQRRMLQQHNTFWLPSSQSPHGGQQSSQIGGTGTQPGGTGGVQRSQNLIGPPILHSLNSTSTFPQSLGNQTHHQQAQFLSLQRSGNAMSGRVCAPISPISSGVPLHEALHHRNLQAPPPPMATGSIQPSLYSSNQSSLHGKQQTLTTPPGTAQLTFQRVT